MSFTLLLMLCTVIACIEQIHHWILRRDLKVVFSVRRWRPGAGVLTSETGFQSNPKAFHSHCRVTILCEPFSAVVAGCGTIIIELIRVVAG